MPQNPGFRSERAHASHAQSAPAAAPASGQPRLWAPHVCGSQAA